MASAEMVTDQVKELCDDIVAAAADELRDAVNDVVDLALVEVVKLLEPRHPDGTPISVFEITANVDLWELSCKGNRYHKFGWWVREMIHNDFEIESEDLANWREAIEQQFAD